MSESRIKSLAPKSGRRSRFKQGYFDVSRSKKYLGPTPCIYRSSWEFVAMKHFEDNPAVQNWSSEPFGIPYVGPTGKPHKYYIDFVLKMTNGEEWLIEIKPFADTVKQNTGRYRQNAYKWTAAKKYAADHGMNFSVVTERHAMLKGKV